MKVFELGPVAQLSWMWVLAPFIVALLWFEAFESMLGMDKRKKRKDQDKEAEKARRIREQFNTSPVQKITETPVTCAVPALQVRHRVLHSGVL
jgi:small Trp-rich protein